VVAAPIDDASATAAGFAALDRGDLEAARVYFDRAVATGEADASAWFGLARAHGDLGASGAESDALDRALKIDSRHLPSLLAKGDLFARQGDLRAADSFYRAALKLAATIPSLPAELRQALGRAQALSQQFARNYESHLLAALGAAGLGSPGTERFTHAIDLLLGRKQIYPQQPKYFYYPELPQIQFFDRSAFPWIVALEGEFESIRAEACAVLETGRGIEPYVQRATDRPASAFGGLLDNPDWGAFFLIKDGLTVAENAVRCPRTLAALRDVPLCRIDGRTPSVLFSLLRSGARIPPHHGFMNARLICHLPLIVPPGGALRVGNETRAWREGEILLFDDSIEHEAWNSSGELRAVLIFDVWRPELSEKERALVAAMLSAINDFDGARRKWTE
jgi:aspartyl/asparaginyl beta-hydroxylase (cupin superfamily)